MQLHQHNRKVPGRGADMQSNTNITQLQEGDKGFDKKLNSYVFRDVNPPDYLLLPPFRFNRRIFCAATVHPSMRCVN
jgi:hypothetical protein